MKRTIIALKLRASRRLTYELWWIVKLLALVLLVPTIALATVQLIACRRAHPARTMRACLAPMLKLGGK